MLAVHKITIVVLEQLTHGQRWRGNRKRSSSRSQHYSIDSDREGKENDSWREDLENSFYLEAFWGETTPGSSSYHPKTFWSDSSITQNIIPELKDCYENMSLHCYSWFILYLIQKRFGDEERRLMHLVPAPAVKLMKGRVLSRPGMSNYSSLHAGSTG